MLAADFNPHGKGKMKEPGMKRTRAISGSLLILFLLPNLTPVAEYGDVTARRAVAYLAGKIDKYVQKV